jgi:hypothetical protein
MMLKVEDLVATAPRAPVGPRAGRWQPADSELKPNFKFKLNCECAEMFHGAETTSAGTALLKWLPAAIRVIVMIISASDYRSAFGPPG